jgi:hypothetical protein
MTTTRCCSFREEYNLLNLMGSYRQLRKICWPGINFGQVIGPSIGQTRWVQQEKVLNPLSGVPDYENNEVHLGMESFVRQVI